jgi:hypothetical protein
LGIWLGVDRARAMEQQATGKDLMWAGCLLSTLVRGGLAVNKLFFHDSISFVKTSVVTAFTVKSEEYESSVT